MIHILSASAGSGKTHTLALSYLKELIKSLPKEAQQSTSIKGQQDQPIYLSNILVLTFTKKAAFEMKDRIIRFLEDIALQRDLGEKLAGEMKISPKQAKAILEFIFLNYHRFSVSTLDSFLFRLFRGLAYELDLPSRINVVETLREELIERALSRFYLKAENDERIFALLLNLAEFIVQEEEKGTLNLKKRLIKGLKDFIELTVRGRELSLNEAGFLSTCANNLLPLSFEEEFSEEPNQPLSFRAYRRGKLYFSLFRELKQCLEEVLLENRQVYMGFWKEKLKQHLLDNGLIPWIYFKLGRIDCLMMDESQDTDVLHFHNLMPILVNLRAEGKPIYFAWDPKQSIYRWRGANPEYLQDIINDLTSKVSYIKIKLEKNYRSCKNIVTFNNHLFSHLSEETLDNELTGFLRDCLKFDQKDSTKITNENIKEKIVNLMLKRLKEMFKDVRQSAEIEMDGKVVIYYVKGQTKPLKEMIFEVIDGYLHELKKSGQLRNTGILLRNNNDLAELQQYLSEKGYQITSKAMSSLAQSPLAVGLLGYLELLIDNQNDLALSKILANLFSEEGQQLLEGYARYCAKLQVSRLTLKEYLESFHPQFFRENILIPLAQGKRLAPYDYLQYLLRRLPLGERLHQEKLSLQCLLSLVLRRQGQIPSFKGLVMTLLEEIRTKGLRLPANAEVMLLTIHTSKGLEFNNVITVLDYHYRETYYWTGFPIKLQTERGIFMGRMNELSDEPELEQYLSQLVGKVLEMINLIYVSFTRAKRNLCLIVPLKEKDGNIEAASPSAKLFLKLWKLVNLEDRSFVVERSLAL